MNQSLFANAIDIRLWLESDAGNPEQDRVTRDRRIGKLLADTSDAAKFKRVLAWWNEISTQTSPPCNINLPGHRVVAMVNLAAATLFMLGMLLGISVAGVAFAYTGNFPVNLFALLGVLVGLPLLMLISSLLLIKIRILIPASLRDAMAILNPGRWVGSWLERRIPTGLFESMLSRPIHSNFARWQLMAFSQSFAIGYFIGVLAVAWLLIIFTDLAFGWSTTLEIETATVWRGLNTISMPWSGLLPGAVPDLTLVEASRFYRLEDHAIDANRAATLGSWWPFVLMVITTYGLLPRILLALVAKWQLYKARRQLLEEGAEITALLDRLSTPSITFEGPLAEETPTETASLPGITSLHLDATSKVIIWNNVLSDKQFSDWTKGRAADPQPPISAAEWQSVREQREALEQIKPEPDRFIILTKGWEPPLLAFNDYLALLRSVMGPSPVVAVVPLDITNGVNPADRDVWMRALAGHQDPGLYVVGATS